MKAVPAPGYILIKPIKLDSTTSGIELPDSAKGKLPIGKVLAVGYDYTNEHGVKQTTSICKGDVIVYANYSEQSLKTIDEEYQFIPFDKAVATLEEL